MSVKHREILGHCDCAIEIIIKLEAERDRYKEALYKIANFKEWTVTDKSTLLLQIESAQKLAQQALEGGEK